MSYSAVAPLVGVLTLAAIAGGTLYLLAACERIVSRTPENDEDDAAPPR